MVRRSIVAVLIFWGTISVSFAQNVSIADRAREERASRRAFSSSEALPAVSDLPVPTGQALIEEALQFAGARRQLQQLVENSLGFFSTEKLPEGVSPQEYRETLTQVFDVDRLVGSMETFLSSGISENLLSDVVHWYRSPLGIKIAAADLNAHGPDASAQLQLYAASVRRDPPSADRIKLIEQLDEYTGTTRNTVHMLFSLVMAIHKGLTGAGAPIPPPPRDFERIFRIHSTAALRQELIFSSLCAYRGISELELTEYVNFRRSQSATLFDDAVGKSMNAAFRDAAQQLSRALAEKK